MENRQDAPSATHISRSVHEAAEVLTSSKTIDWKEITLLKQDTAIEIA